MLQKKARLPGAQVNYLLHKGKYLPHKFFTVRFLPNKSLLSRFCIIVSAKVEKKAVKRNRLRRQIYEIIRLNQQPLTSNYDIVLKVKNNILELNYQGLKDQILTIFHHLNTFQK